MKHGWKILISATVLAVAALTACGSKGGGGSTANTPAGCIADASGNCSVAVGPAGYIGDGTWQAQLMVNDSGQFQQFAIDNGLCSGYNCAYLSNYLKVTLYLRTGGCLPGQGTFQLQMYQQGSYMQPFVQRADTYINSSSNGFVMNYIGNPGYANAGYIPGQSVASNGLQINTQFIDGNHVGMNIQLVYHGRQIAYTSQPGYGQPSYNAQAAANGGQYCAQTGFGQGGAYGLNGYQQNYGFGVNYNVGNPYVNYVPYSRVRW